ncbi:diphosphomevalonate/mevalonate 3,5-bisphosphate decarboxylase family protein [Riemerella columbipharyngis]|uniref:Diphosphomevalonate decarboxylase n=1 Tax=Riemerella columbipharyngis TaxID=1071918 RepID=A0A1G6ZQQ7_9FLAO|nr:diphosphomevalonate decarboxylase [Riemerella columbipharyngis]SDE03896.1 diphosphomevalonate decarboxylase [Riemerella columbipharyngis]
MSDIFLGKKDFSLKSTIVEAECPSNIALIKYWGKFPSQIPANPSISYTLNYAKTNTKIDFTCDKSFGVRLFLGGKEEVKFAEKIALYFKTIESYLPWVLKGEYIIRTENSFPHSSGIASSASGFGAIAKGLMQLDKIFTSSDNDEFSIQKASFLARLGSGSACRSLYKGLVVWGETLEVEGSSNLFGVPYPKDEVHPIFRSFNDWVLLIHEGQKSVSSTLGHALMDTNPYAKRRFQEAKENFIPLKKILKKGDLEGFMKLVEHEALSLHAMMMMCDPAVILMKTNTLNTINRIWAFRKESQLPLFFTLDAGANVHLLFPNNGTETEIKSFINTELLPFAQNRGVVKDEMIF